MISMHTVVLVDLILAAHVMNVTDEDYTRSYRDDYSKDEWHLHLIDLDANNMASHEFEMAYERFLNTWSSLS